MCEFENHLLSHNSLNNLIGSIGIFQGMTDVKFGLLPTGQPFVIKVVAKCEDNLDNHTPETREYFVDEKVYGQFGKDCGIVFAYMTEDDNEVWIVEAGFPYGSKVGRGNRPYYIIPGPYNTTHEHSDLVEWQRIR